MTVVAHPGLGIAADLNEWWTDQALCRADVQRWREMGIQHALLMSGSVYRADPMLGILDASGITVVVGGQEEVQPFLAGAGPDTQAQADSVVAPVAAILNAHPSVEGVLVDDDPTVARISRLQKVVDAYRRLCHGKTVTSTMVGLHRAGRIQQACGFDAMALQMYPCGTSNLPGSMLMNAFGYSNLTAAEYVRLVQQEAGVTTQSATRPPLWIVAQGHYGDGLGLRQPTPDEIRQQYNEARKLGASRVYWFAWHTQVTREPQTHAVTGTVFTGIKDQPASQIAIAELDGAFGVTASPVNYSLTADAFWGAHPYNKESANYRPRVKHPGPWLDVDEYAGNLWAAIQALPQSGGTVWLSSATYNGTQVYEGSFSGLARNNVHLVAKPGATPTINGILTIIPCFEARDYIPWSQMLATNANTNVDDPNVPGRKLKAREIVRDYQVRGWHLEGLTFDGQGVNVKNVSYSTARECGILNCTFQGIVHPGGTSHPAHVTGNSHIDHIWLRGCLFRGQAPYSGGLKPWLAVYLDGLHVGGVLDSTFTAGAFSKGDVLFLTNDDFSRDYNIDGAITLDEQRMATYVYSVDNWSGAGDKHVGVTGSRWAVIRMLRTGASFAWAAVHSESKSNNIDNTPIPPFRYDFLGGVVRDCWIENMGGTIYLLRQTSQSAAVYTPPKVDPIIGQHTVMGNVVDDAGFARWVLTEGPNAAGHVGPNTVGSNGTTGGPTLPVPWLPTEYAYLPPIDPLVLAQERIAELEQECAANDAVIATLTGSVNTLTAANASLSASLASKTEQCVALTADLDAALDERDALAAWKSTTRTVWASLRAQMEV